jgi:type II restriction/modification system DNA methylase subunit YeeA
MNKANLKSYAPQARKDFIAAITARANLLGLSEKAGKLEVAASQPQGDVTVIAGQAWPVKVHTQREQLITRIRKDGFAQTMEAVAYTWFNRFAALRYMELHDYLDHGHRALSSKEGALPDILTQAANLAQSGGLPGLKMGQITEMKLAGTRDGELYHMLLVAQCNALSAAMPFLFERIDDETELLLPDNLLRTDSVIAKLVDAIDEEDWKEVEIIGWLYQFYISEKKDDVIGKVVKSEDIPAATQLFTPNWIVQYLVQNSVGRLWLMANPASTLKAQWPYYIEPAQQTPEVQAQLDALIQTRTDEDGGSLNPESITLLDPACGSGHILVVAYDILKAIYLERGYQPRTIPRLILEKNLYGLDIDDRAAQMAGFALLMKARADDRRLFNKPIKLNVLSLQESKGLDADVLTRAFESVTGRVSSQIDASISTSEFGATDLFPGTSRQMNLGDSVAADTADSRSLLAIAALIDTFAHAKTFGSLIQIPQALNEQLAPMTDRLALAFQNGDLYAKAAAQDLWPLVAQARVLGMRFDTVAANPPYMGDKAQAPEIKVFIKTNFPSCRADLFAAFIDQGMRLAKDNGFVSFITMQSWMFLSSFAELRKTILADKTISSLLHVGFNSFPELNSKVALACATTFFNTAFRDYLGCYVDLNSAPPSADKAELFDKEFRQRTHIAKHSDFSTIPSYPVAYWVSTRIRSLFAKSDRMGAHADARQGMATTDNQRFLRFWYEIAESDIERGGANFEGKWFPYNKGGEFRKWAGNHLHVVRYERGGELLLNLVRQKYPKISDPEFVIKNRKYYFLEGITWTDISLDISARIVPQGFIFDTAGPMAFLKTESEKIIVLAVLNSKLCGLLSSILNPTLHFTLGDFSNLPFLNLIDVHLVSKLVLEAIDLAQTDWDSSYLSSGFMGDPLIKGNSLPFAWQGWKTDATLRAHRLAEIETQINSQFIDAYDLAGEFDPSVQIDQVTCLKPDREKDCQRLMSYAIGCMMGRYSLDAPGLIYANAGNVDFDPSRYVKFSADSDGIVPLTDELWFEDDAASCIREFLLAVWGADSLTENTAWLAESLGAKDSETPDESIRRYLADKFYKDHLQTYKKRPIYWLFSSGKQGAFQALVYLHRYHEGTLARLRAEYVVPLTGKIQSRIDMLQKDAEAASNTAARNKLAKEVEKLKKKRVELLAYDEQLRHYADMRITLDLDDGVKVNYGKFGELLAEVKAVTGGAADD